LNFIIFVLSKFRTELISSKPFYHMRERAKFDPEEKFLKCMLEIMILVSSANNIDSDIEFILRRRSFIYINFSLTGVHWNMEFPQGSILGLQLFIISSCIR